MSADAVTMLWAAVQAVQVLLWTFTFVRTLRASTAERLPVLLAAVPAMYGTLVFSVYVETWVLGHPADWSPRPGALEATWQPWWGPLAGGAPIALGMGLYALKLVPTRSWTTAAAVAGLASAAAGILALALLN